MPPRLTGLTKLTLETAPTVCHECIWWQTRGRRTTDKGRWMEKIELDFGAWGTVYYDSDRRVLGSMLITCAYLVDPSSPWVLQSLFLAAIGEARDRGAACLEAFSYRYAERESSYERFRVHRTVFPQDFLADFGFQVVRSAGRVGLSRLELGGLQPVEEGRREKVLAVVRSAFGVPEREPIPAPRP
jgi:hypothetical protein